ncbi:glycosyltransferase family 4 protein [Sulfurimonas sp.]
MNKKKTVIELCMSPDLGGLELYMVRAAKALRSEFDVLSVINTNTKLLQYYDSSDDVVHLNKKSNFFMFSSANKLAKIIDERGVDVIHLHWTKDIPFVVLAKLLSKKKPKLVQTRNMTMTRFKDDFYHKFLYKNIDLMLAVTHQVKAQLEKFIPQNIRPQIEVLYMGSDKTQMLNRDALEKFKSETGLKESNFNVGMVGRINEAKGQHLLIKALAKIEDESIQAYFVGHEMKEGYIHELEQLAQDLGVGNRVHFLGFMKNPHHFFQACDAIVLASKKETFGLVLIEAMQVQTAVVGSNSGGVVEIIDDEETGLLFNVGSHNSLAEKIVQLRENRELRNTIATNGKEKCEQMFSNELQFKKLSKILKDLCES